jgi:hypothetical protein
MDDLLDIGQSVTIGDDIPATITAVCVRGISGNRAVTYEVCWWDDRDRKEQWLPLNEITPAPARSPRLTLGFVMRGDD